MYDAVPVAFPPPPVKAFLRRHPRLRTAARGAVAAVSRPVGTLTRVAIPETPEVAEPLAALTFDDGPDPAWTPRLLDLLEAHGARGTFFMVGTAAARHPEIAERAFRAGHAVGNHTWDHPSMPLLGRRDRRLQIRRAAEALAPWDRGERLFRPPYGEQTPASWLDARRLGYRVVTWDVVAEDWRDDAAEVLVRRVGERMEPGSIVLFHDALYTTIDHRYDDRGPTLGAVEMLLKDGRFRFVTVPELLRHGRPVYWPWFKRTDRDWQRRLV